ncbi:MAG TPA: hypothetical protein VFE16_14425 [Candidatus Cybelea sp.]|nr:hypothetical protein [Candidatus Cybelea sp.]
MNAGSSGSSLPNAGDQSAAATRDQHVMNWTPISSAGWRQESGPREGQNRPPQIQQRGGNYAEEFRSDVGVFGYSPKPNKTNNPPVCSPPGNRYNVNGIASDEKGNLIVPGSSKPAGKNTSGWNISVYFGSTQPTICGALLGAIPDTTGQPVDAASFNAVLAPIAVSEINFTTKLGELVICTLSSLSCGAPVTSSAITGYSAGVAMDASGNCWLSTAKKLTNGIPAGFRLVYFAGCAGNGVAADGTGGQSSYGGLFIDNAGNIGSLDAFNSKLHVYSGCNPHCTSLYTFTLQGQSFYPGLNGSAAKLAVGDETNGSCDVYNYMPPTFTLRYSFNAGLKHSRLVESCIFAPDNQRMH